MDNATDNAMHQHRHEGSDYRRIELITGLSRRRRWTADEKAAIVTESLQPGVNISELARLWGVNRGLLQTWRRAMIREGESFRCGIRAAPSCGGFTVSRHRRPRGGKRLLLAAELVVCF